MQSYIRHKTYRNKNPTAISGEHNIKRSHPSTNALHCLQNLYAAILLLPSVNTRRDFAAVLKSIARSQGRVPTNQTSETKLRMHKFACTNVTHRKKEKSPENLQLVRYATGACLLISCFIRSLRGSYLARKVLILSFTKTFNIINIFYLF